MKMNTLPIKNSCPRCGRKETLHFTPDYAEDTAFVECAKNQPWRVLCVSCRDLILKKSATRAQALDAMRGWELPA